MHQVKHTDENNYLLVLYLTQNDKEFINQIKYNFGCLGTKPCCYWNQ